MNQQKTYDLSTLAWRVAGVIPNDWVDKPIEAIVKQADVPPVPAAVPGSVQQALLDTGTIPDWRIGLNSRACEWVENRHWVFYAAIPNEWLHDLSDTAPDDIVLDFESLDYQGVVRVNGRVISPFRGSFTEHRFPVGSFLTTPSDADASATTLEVIFTDIPRWLGQLGYTSRMTEWKTRFNYTWDWTSRLVQIGIVGAVRMYRIPRIRLSEVRAVADVTASAKETHGATEGGDPGVGTLRVQGTVAGEIEPSLSVRVTLSDERDGAVVMSESIPADRFRQEGLQWSDLVVSPWWANGQGRQPLYRLTVRLRNREGESLDAWERVIGFRHIEWLPCEGAPPDARPWVCAVNGRPTFLIGVNWTPIKPNYADVTDEEVRSRVSLYRDLGFNILRVWGGATLETEAFYDACDEYGMLVWQEFPLSSSGPDNWPPEDAQAIAEMTVIGESYVRRRRHHPSLLLWCGGNELQGGMDGTKAGIGKPIDESHPMIGALAEVVHRLDPGRRFLPTSSSGPRFGAEERDFGKGLHHDVHGPWRLPGESIETARRYWLADDALFRSEVGVPGASPVDVIEEFAGDLPTMPASLDSPLWRRTSWWIDWDAFVAEHGRDPADLEEYVSWSQTRQAEGLAIAAGATRDRFPAVGGFIVWMGHDCFPCTANTAIIDIHGRPKPAALALKELFLT